jgi:ligand-binding sensor domain-containing protein
LTPFTTVDGLGSNRVQCVEAAPDGEVWVGTADAGITRIFSDRTARYLTALPGQLDVRAIAFSGANAWYGGPNGAGRIVNGLPERSFREEDGLVSADVRAVAARASKAWFGTVAGISEFDIQANDLVTRNEGLDDLDVRAMAIGAGVVYAGTATGLYQMNESGPRPVWEAVTPPLVVEVVDLAARGDRLVVVGPNRRVWTRSGSTATWTSTQLGMPDDRVTSATIDDQDRIFLGGRRGDRSVIGLDATPLIIDFDGAESPVYRQLHGTQFFGLGADREGGAWVGAFPVDAGVSHWRADGRVVAYMDEETGPVGGPYNNDGWLQNLKIDVLETSSGDVWVSSFQQGLTRLTPAPDDDPAAASYLQVTEHNSPIGMNRIYSMGEDPFGNLWFCAPGEVVTGDFNAGIDVLLDPDDPYDSANWVHIRPNNSLLAGEGFHDITFDGDRVAWLTVRGVGLQRFVYGDGTGFDPATLTNPASWRTIRALPESAQDNLGAVRQVAVGANGRYWVATKGQGVFSFTYTTSSITGARQYRTDGFGTRILSDDAVSVGVDSFGDTWVATEIGLNRIREGGDDTGVAAFTDLQNFLAYELGEDYSFQILRALPGGAPVTLELSEAGPWLYTVSARGISRVDLTPGEAPPVDGEGPGFSVYPNPVRAGDDEVVIGGFEGQARVEIYDLQGRTIRKVTVEAGQRVWGLQTLSGDPVANGLYLVRVILDGRSSSRVLAVER